METTNEKKDLKTLTALIAFAVLLLTGIFWGAHISETERAEMRAEMIERERQRKNMEAIGEILLAQDGTTRYTDYEKALIGREYAKALSGCDYDHNLIDCL